MNYFKKTNNAFKKPSQALIEDMEIIPQNNEIFTKSWLNLRESFECLFFSLEEKYLSVNAK